MAVRGSDAVVGVYDETTYATAPVSPDGRLLYFTECSLQPTRENVVSATMSSDRNRTKPGLGNLDITGNLAAEIAPEMGGWYLKHALGVPVTTGSSSPYTHTFRPKALPVGFIVEVDWSAAITGKVHRFLGCRASQATITVPQSGFATISMSVGASDFDIAAAPLDATLTDPGQTGWTAANAVVKLNGTASCLVKSATITINNNMETDRYTLCGGTRYDMPEGFVDVTGEITALFDVATHALIDAAFAQTDTNIEIILTHGTGAGTAGNEQLSLKIDHSQVALNSPPITSPGGLEVTFSLSAFKSGSTDKGLVCVLKNAVPAASL
jgi:hypothetical protein